MPAETKRLKVLSDVQVHSLLVAIALSDKVVMYM